MKRNFTLPVIFLLFTFLSASAQNVLRIQDPDGWDFQGFQGNITEATFSIQPQGAYMEVGMFLTFSDEGLGFNSWDSTEIILDFNLPEGSIVYDSWLWMFDDTTIVRADIHDIWTATTIYENIVDRRRDPSVLFRKPSGSYQIRIYPLPYNETRKIKISYLVPAVWSAGEVNAWLPTGILETSGIPLDFFEIITFPNPIWQNPRLNGLPDVTFQNVADPNFGDILVAQIPSANINKPFSFAVDAPFNSDGVFVQQLDNGTDKFYQAVYLPPEISTPANPKKVVFLVDHEDANSSIDKTDFYQYLEEECKTYLKSEDQFNFIFSSTGNHQMMSENWILGNADSITQAFSQMTNPIKDYSDLFDLLENGINFLIDNGEAEGDIVLLANSDNITWNNNSDIESINTLLQGTNIKINIINYQSDNFYQEWVWNGPDFWTSNNYNFYRDLTFSTGGRTYGSLQGASNVWTSISSLLSSLKSADYDFDMYTSLTSGFTFNRFHQNYLGQSRNVNQPILQVGKYTGAFPFEIEYSAYVDSNFIFETIEVPTDQIMESDSVNREIWFGHHLWNLQSTASGVSGIQEIIDLSIEERVLTDYTAFLALDLENGGEPCVECWEFEEWIVYSTDDDLEDQLKIKIAAFPNPFSDQVKVTIELSEGLSVDEAELSIFDAFGKNVLNQKLNDLTDFGKSEWTWNGQNSNGQSLPSGIYYMMIKTEKGAQTVKLTLMR